MRSFFDLAGGDFRETQHAMTGIGHLYRKPLEGLSTLPWLAQLLADDVDAAVHGLNCGTPTAEQLAQFAATHHLGPLLWPRIDSSAVRDSLPETLRNQWQQAYVRQWLANSNLARDLHRLHQAFTRTGKNVILLKGPHLATSYYGDLAQRKFEDIDLLVPSGSAKSYLRWLKTDLKLLSPMLLYSLRSYLTHAQVLSGEGLIVDLHWALRCHPSYAIDEPRIWQTRQAFTLPELGDRIDVLDDEYTLVLTLLEIFDDLSRLELTVKDLIDAFLILRVVDHSMDWQGFFARRKTEHLYRITTDVLMLILKLFDAHNLLPNLVSNLKTQAPKECQGLKMVLRPGNRWHALWSYRLSLYEMSRWVTVPYLLFSGPIRVVL